MSGDEILPVSRYLQTLPGSCNDCPIVVDERMGVIGVGNVGRELEKIIKGCSGRRIEDLYVVK